MTIAELFDMIPTTQESLERDLAELRTQQQYITERIADVERQLTIELLGETHDGDAADLEAMFAADDHAE